MSQSIDIDSRAGPLPTPPLSLSAMSQQSTDAPPLLRSEHSAATRSPFIPLPPTAEERHNFSYCFATYIAEEDKDQFMGAKVLVRKLSPMALDVRHTWGQQDPDRRQGLLSNILSAYPTFEKYEDFWPIRYYCIRHHCFCRSAFHKTRRNTARARAARVTKRAPVRTSIVTQHWSRESSVTLVQESATFNGPIPRESPCPDAPGDPLPETPPASAAPVGCASAAPGQDSRHMATEHKELRLFLRTIDDAFECLVDRLVAAGLKDMTRLMLMAEWDEAERNEFLRKECRLDPFECKVVCDALRARCSSL